MDNFIVTANIYGGFQIIDRSSEPKVVGMYDVHSSLAYGADWSHLDTSLVSKMYGSNCNSYLIGTCSFYDKKFTLSTWVPGET